MSIFKTVKAHLPEHKSVISDGEFLLLDRRDFHMTQISAVHATLMALKINPGYPFRVLMSFLDQFAAGLKDKDVNVLLADPSMTVAAFQFWIRAGADDGDGRTYAPRGVARMPKAADIQQDLIQRFEQKTLTSPSASPLKDGRQYFTVVLGNTKSQEQTHFAVDRYLEMDRALLVLKDYARVGAFDERDYLESKLVFPSVTFEGHGFALKL